MVGVLSVYSALLNKCIAYYCYNQPTASYNVNEAPALDSNPLHPIS